MSKKPELSAGLIATKGSAAPVPDMPPRTPTLATPAAPARAKGEELQPLNFKVPASFRRAFKTYAATHDLKLNELLQRSFEAYRKAQGD